jgi:hypothetical protein
LAALDFVAVGEHRMLDARAIEKRTVATLAILVVRQSKLHPPRLPPDGHALTTL